MGGALDAREDQLGLLEGVKAVLLDFDGPVCDLFGNVSTAPVADEIKEKVRLVWGRDLDQKVEDCHDSHGILLLLQDMYDPTDPYSRSREALRLAEETVTAYEGEAVLVAHPAPGIEKLVNALRCAEIPLVIVSNNAAKPIKAYLERWDLLEQFQDVIGRDPHHLHHMKPHPDSVERALESLGGLPPSECVLIGDQLTDLEAAQAAKTRFVGYTQSPVRAAEMLKRGAHAVVSSHEPLINAAEAMRKPN